MSKPIAKLGDYMPKNKVTRKSVYTKPHFFKLLAKAIDDNKKTGELIGLSGSAVNHDLSKDKTRLVNELAAKHVYKEKYPDAGVKGEQRTAVIVASPHQIKTVKELIEALGGKSHLIPKDQ